MSNYSRLRCVEIIKGNPKTLNLETGIWNPEPETRIQNPDTMNDDRNNSLQQCLINK